MKILKTIACLVAVLSVAGCSSFRQYSGGTGDETTVETGAITSGTTTPTVYRPQSPFGTAAPIAIQPMADPDF